MKRNCKLRSEHPTLRAVRIALTALLVLLGVGMLVLGISIWRVGRGIDYEADLELLESYSGSRTTRLYRHRGGFTLNEPLSELGYDPIELDRVCGAEDRVWLSSREIPRLVRDAFVAIEDKRFYQHDGVDWKRTSHAALNSVLHFGRRFGGSTITQQLIKNVSGESEATVTRKLREILRATALEKSLTKDEILTYYLNIIPLANRCYGVASAARCYFGKSVAELLPEEAAVLAAIINAPARYDPIRHPKENRRRRDIILSVMAEQGYLSQDEAKAAMARDTVFHLTEPRQGVRVHGWYTETVLSEVIRDLQLKLGISEKSAEAMVYGGGLSIHTLCAAELQAAVDAHFENLGSVGEAGASAAFVLIDPRDGALLAVRGASGKKEGNRLLNYATVLRPPGSALKPIALYAPALKARLIHYGTVFDDVPTEQNWPHNTPDVYDGRTPICKALALSKNTVAVKLYEMLGAQRIADELESDYGISGIRRGTALTDLAPAPLALGQMTDGVDLLHLTAAYTVFASGGTYRAPRSYLAVYDRRGRCLLKKEPQERRVLSEEDAYIMTELLSGVTEYGTASNLSLTGSVAIAGKTGTSGDTLDRWFIGYTPMLLGGVLITGNGKTLSGSGLSQTALWDSVMCRIHAPLLSQTRGIGGFSPPVGIVRAEFCADSGRRPTAACEMDPRGERIMEGPFTLDNLPEGDCDTHILLGYDRFAGGYRKIGKHPFLFFFRPLTVALDDSGRAIVDGSSVTDRAYDLSVILGERKRRP